MAVIKAIDEEVNSDGQQFWPEEEKRLSTITRNGNGPSSFVPNYEEKVRIMLEHVIPMVQEILKQQEQLSFVNTNPTPTYYDVFIKVPNTVKEVLKMDREVKAKYCILKEILQENSNDSGVKVSNILKTILEMERLITAQYCELKDMIDRNLNKNTGVNEASDILKAVEMDKDMKSQYCTLNAMFEENLNQNASVHKEREGNQDYCMLKEIIDPNLNIVLSKIAVDISAMSLSVGEILATIKMQLEILATIKMQLDKTDFPSIFCAIMCLCVTLLGASLSWSGPETNSVTSVALECAVLCCVTVTFFICLIAVLLVLCLFFVGKSYRVPTLALGIVGVCVIVAVAVNFSLATNEPENDSLPKQIHEIKDFLLTARRKDARSVKIKKSRDVVKFKVRCSKYLYTLCVSDAEKADKLKQSLPPGLSVQDL
ncbi:hypothetical protein V6N13_070201 [Hibiscus sabdariffa]